MISAERWSAPSASREARPRPEPAERECRDQDPAAEAQVQGRRRDGQPCQGRGHDRKPDVRSPRCSEADARSRSCDEARPRRRSGLDGKVGRLEQAHEVAPREARAGVGLLPTARKGRPSISSPISTRRASSQSTSYQLGSTTTGRPSSSARASVWRNTRSVLQSTSWKSRRCGVLDADQIVAAIGRRADHHSVSGGGQRRGGRHEVAGRQRRAVGIEQAHGFMSRRQQRVGRAKEAGAEVGRHRLEQTDAVGQDAGEEIAASPPAHTPSTG